MPVYDDDLDDLPPPNRPSPPRPGAVPRRQNPLIPLLNLRKWTPPQADIDKHLGSGRPEYKPVEGFTDGHAASS